MPRFLLLAIVFLRMLIPVAGSAQSLPYCLVEAEWLPVEEVRGKTPYVFDGDELVRGSARTMDLRPVDAFGPGFARVEVIANKRPNVVNEEGVLRFTAPRALYRLKARLVAEVELEDCYYVLRLDDYGQGVYVCKALGTLRKGEVREIDIVVKVGYEMPQQLHLFSVWGEVRTSLVPRPYHYANGAFGMTAE